MRKLTQKLVLSVVTMALVVIALGTSTFAWFTLTDTAKVDTFNAEVQAGNGILVSLDNVNFYTVIDSATMNAFLVQNMVQMAHNSTLKIEHQKKEEYS